MSNGFIDLGHFDFQVLVQVFIPENDVVGMQALVVSEALQIGIKFLGLSIVIQSGLGWAELVLVVGALLGIFNVWSLSQMSCAIVEEILFVGRTPENCPRKALFFLNFFGSLGVPRGNQSCSFDSS